MIVERYRGLIDLPDEDKLSLIAELGDDLTACTAADDPELASLVEARWREFQQRGGPTSPWSEVKARILASRR